jgi:putative FmdB family regulatory protein
MPIFEFKCDEHGVFEELFQKADHAADLCECPKCFVRCPRIIPLIAHTPTKWGASPDYFGK